MIRSAKQRDIAAMTQLTVDGRFDNYRAMLDEEHVRKFMAHNTIEKTAKRVAERMRRRGAVGLVYEQPGEIIGYIFGNTIEQRITHLFVRADARGRGIGHALLNEYFEKTNQRSWTIEVVERNERAIDLYKRYGFEVVGIKRRLYFGLQKIIMRRVN